MDKRKEILTEALGELPVYDPDHSNWIAIEDKLDKEQNSLYHSKFAQMDPPDFIWEKLDKELDYQEKLTKLPLYNPPSLLWEQINKQLNFSNEGNLKPKQIKWPIWLATMAAAMLIVSFIVFQNQNNFNENSTTIEAVSNSDNKHIWDSEDSEIEQTISLICSQNPTSCLSQEFVKLENDLIDLTLSRKDILNQMETNKTRSDLDLVLTEIELKRSDILKEMIKISI